MKKEKLTARQTITLLTMFFFGSTGVLGVNTDVGQDSWLAFLMAAAIAFPFMLMYSRLCRLYPDKSFFELAESLLGKVGGKIVVALLTWYCLHLCSLVMRNFSEYIQVCTMPETPQLPVMLFMMLGVVYLVKSGVETMGKWSVLMLPLIVAVVILTVLFALNRMDFSRLLPIARHDLGSMANSAYYSVMFPYLEIIVFVCAFSGSSETEKPYKPYIAAFFVATALMLTITLRDTMILGAHVLDALNFPSYVAVKIIQIGEVISRIEGSISMNYILSGIAKCSVCLLAAAKGIAYLFGLREHKQFLFPLGLLVVALSTIVFDNLIQMFEFIQVYNVYSVPFSIIIPVLIWILAEFKHRKESKAQTPANTQA